jgi:uncharacterized protein YggU (UPF0235/DUF167 family)
MKQPDLSDLSVPGATLDVRVTPKAARNAIRHEDGLLRVSVTEVPENGKATAAVIKLLSKALGLPKSRLTLIHGEASRNKRFRIDP